MKKAFKYLHKELKINKILYQLSDDKKSFLPFRLLLLD